MNPLHPDSPIRNTINRLTLAISPVILACCLASQAQAQWSYSAWTNDVDSGITNASSYTVAVNLGGAATTVNGVAFQASALTGPNFAIGGGAADFTGTPNITGNSLALASNFIYGGNPRTVTLTNLTPGATYETSLFAYGYGASTRSQTFTSGSDSVVVDQNYYGQNQGIRITYTFVADSSGSKELTIAPEADDTFHISALANRRVTPTSWSYSAWTSDADSGITNASSYTMAVNLGGAATTVNGVAFQASALTGPNFSIGGDVAYYSGTPNITGDCLALASNFIYGGNPRTVTLTNLTPGVTYETSLFAFGWDNAPTSRSQTFASGSDSLVLAQNFYGQNQGIRITYTFVADSSGTQELTVTPVAGGSFHLSALANRRVTPTSWSYSAWTSDADSGITNASPYTVAVNFGGDATTVNGVVFEASALTGPNFSIGGGVLVFTGGTPTITGNSLALASSFIYQGNPRTVTLTNLTPGATYETSLFAYGYDAAPTSRSQTFASGSDSLVLAQNFYGQNQGIRITYTFVADSSGSQELTITPVAGDTFHMSALANRQVSGSSPYTTWANAFLPGNDVSNPAGDNDNDGLTNQQEFAFGLSPISGSSVNPILVDLDKTTGQFSYQRRAGSGLTYKILTSTTLATGSWTEDATAGQVATAIPSTDNESVVVTLTTPPTAAKFFIRVSAN